MATILFRGEVSNDYHQIYLCDSSLPELPNDYSDAAIARRVTAGAEAIIIQIEREMPVPVEIVLHDARPAIDLAAFDHAVQTAFSVPSGVLVLAGLLDYAPDAPHLVVPVGRFGAIVTFAGLATLNEDGLKGEDRYAVHLWRDPDAAEPVVVLKEYCGPI